MTIGTQQHGSVDDEALSRHEAGLSGSLWTSRRTEHPSSMLPEPGNYLDPKLRPNPAAVAAIMGHFAEDARAVPHASGREPRVVIDSRPTEHRTEEHAAKEQGDSKQRALKEREEDPPPEGIGEGSGPPPADAGGSAAGGHPAAAGDGDTPERAGGSESLHGKPHPDEAQPAEAHQPKPQRADGYPAEAHHADAHHADAHHADAHHADAHHADAHHTEAHPAEPAQTEHSLAVAEDPGGAEEGEGSEAASAQAADGEGDLSAGRAEAQALAGQIRAHAQEEAAKLRMAGERQAAQIMQGAHSSKAQIDQQATAAQASAHAETARITQALSVQGAQQVTGAQQQAAAATAALTAQSAAREQEVGAQARAHQTRFTQQGNIEAARPVEILQRESLRGQQDIARRAAQTQQDGRAVAARYPGGDEKAQDQRRAAQQVGDDTAADIRGKGPSVASEVQSRGQDLVGKQRAFIASVAERMLQAAPQLVIAVRQLGQTAEAQLRTGGSTVAAQLRQQQGQSRQAAATTQQGALGRLRSTAAAAGRSLLVGAEQQAAQVRAQAHQASAVVRQRGELAAGMLLRAPRPTPSAARRFAADAQQQVAQGANQIEGRLVAAGTQVRGMLGQLAQGVRPQLDSVLGTLRGGLGRIVTTARSSGQQILSRYTATVAQLKTATAAQQAQVAQDGLRSFQQGADEATQRTQGANERYRAEVANGVDQSVQKATEPAGKAKGNAQEAAERAGREHEKSLLGQILSGIWSAIVGIVKGLIIVVAVALVIAAIAAAFGVALTAAGAMLIAGGIMLAIGGTLAYMNRRAHGQGVGSSLFGAAMDSIGITGVKESITGRDDITGEKLNAEQRTERGVTGGFQLVMTVIGVRDAFTAPIRSPQGFSGNPGVLGRIRQGTGGVLSELTGIGLKKSEGKPAQEGSPGRGAEREAQGSAEPGRSESAKPETAEGEAGSRSSERTPEQGSGDTESTGKGHDPVTDDPARGISGEKPTMKSEGTSLDGENFSMEFRRDLSGRAQGLVRALEKRGWVRIKQIHPDDLVSISKWFNKEIGVLQDAVTGRLRLVLGNETGILKGQIRQGEVFVVHTHPVHISRAEHFKIDLQNALPHTEAVVDWSGNIVYFNNRGVLNTPSSSGALQPMPQTYKAAFLDSKGNIVGYARITCFDNGTGGTRIVVSE